MRRSISPTDRDHDATPGRIGHVTVDMERPRDRNSPQANELRTELTEIMRRLGSH
jgi:hypothetical protein